MAFSETTVVLDWPLLNSNGQAFLFFCHVLGKKKGKNDRKIYPFEIAFPALGGSVLKGPVC